MLRPPSATAPLRVLVVGAGPTGALVAHALRRALGHGDEVVVYDKGRGPGGRMATARSTAVDGSRVDSGAQYLTRHAGAPPGVADAWDALLRAGVLLPMRGAVHGDARPGAANFVAPAGVSAVPGFFVSAAGIERHQSVRLLGLSRVPAAAGGASRGRWSALVERLGVDGAAAAPGDGGAFDAVVVTMPPPQVLQLRGDVPAALAAAGLDAPLRAVRYSTRYALLAHFRGGAAADGARAALPFVARYVPPADSGDGAVRFVCVDSEKRAAAVAGAAGARTGAAAAGAAAAPQPHAAVSVVAHSSVEFGARHADDDAAAAVAPRMLAALRALHPALPPPDDVRCHRWRYSQVTAAFVPPAGAAPSGAVLVQPAASGGGSHGGDAPEPPLVLCGDGFSESNFDGCARSAVAAVELLRRCSPAWAVALAHDITGSA